MRRLVWFGGCRLEKYHFDRWARQLKEAETERAAVVGGAKPAAAPAKPAAH